ncbi:MAG: hypothetical protein RL385_3782 [Pseudomonadota bacterium]|jgi:hypothetical protein
MDKGAMTVDQFRTEVVRRRGGRRRGAPPYTAEQRRFAITYARSGQLEGRSIMASAKALGLGEPTLRDWMASDASPTAPVSALSALRSVVVKSEPSRAPVAMAMGLTLTTPAGYRVRGLDVASAAALLKVLG